jgi:hypothetical protein
MVLKLKDGRKELYQWDVGVVADVTIDNVDEVHFANLRFGKAFNVEVKNKTVKIPTEVLQSGADVFCWAFVRGENGGYTKKEQTLNVEKRPRPADYVFEPTEILSWETLKKQVENLEKGTIKTITEQVKLLDLETGLYNVKGGKVLWDEGNWLGCGMYDGILYVDCGENSIKMSAIGDIRVLGVITVSAYVEYYKADNEWTIFQVDTTPAPVIAEFAGNTLPTTKAVIDYVENVKREIQGDLEELSTLVGGAK